MDEQFEAMQNFLPLLRPIESVLFAPLFLAGVMKELPSETMTRGLEPKQEEEVKVREPEEVAVRLRSEKTRERAKIFGMWAGGF